MRVIIFLLAVTSASAAIAQSSPPADPATVDPRLLLLQTQEKPKTPYSVAPGGPNRPVIRPMALIGVFR